MDPFFKRLEELIRNSVLDEAESSPLPPLPPTVEILAEKGSPTTSIAILDHGQITSHCISTLNRENNNNDTLFQACSISKPVFGAAIMRLVDLRYFALEDRICDLLPNEIIEILTRDVRHEAFAKAVTVEQLMSHSSGLSVHGFPGYPDAGKVPSTMQILEGKKGDGVNTQAVKFVSVPGLEFIYSGGGITVLQYLVEHVVKKPLAEIVDEHVFKPLGMTRSYYYLSSEETNVASAYYNGYTPCESKWHVQPEQGAAGLWTTPTDLLKLVRAVQQSLMTNDDNMSNGVDHPVPFLRRETAQKMLTRVLGDMARSWFIDSSSFGHGGSNNPGYRAFVFGYADLPWNIQKSEETNDRPTVNIPSGCGISIMTNSASGIAVYSKIIHAIQYLKNWPSMFESGVNGDVPFRASLRLSEDHFERWKEWIGESWSGTHKWRIGINDKGDPVTRIEGQDFDIILRPAAVPPKQFKKQSESIDLILEGLEIMFRFGWEKSERIIEVHNCASGESTMLRRKDK